MSKRNNKPFPTSNSRRGSVLVIVVAVLTMIALIGTAYIATTRLDRYSAQNSVVNAAKEASRDDYIAQAEKLVKEVIANDFDSTVTGPRTCPWLADRLPQPVNPDLVYHINNNPAIWRFITGKLHPDLEDDRYFPPMWPPINAPANGNGVPEVAMMLLEGVGVHGQFGANRYGARPYWITLRYPNDYPVEAYRNKVRTYPAFQFWNPITERFVPNNNKPYAYLAGDADGDGAADSVLYRISSGPVQGVTYYMGVRIIDNSSAININTARTRGDASYDSVTDIPFDPTGQGLRTFFPSSIGLRELFMVRNNFTPRPNPGYELWDIDDYRFGFYDKWSRKTDNKWDLWVPWPDVVAEERLGTGVTNRLLRNDFAYTTLGESLSMQVAYRMEHPGMNRVGAYNPPVADRAAANDTKVFRFQTFDDASIASLAYRFCMVRLDPETNDVRDSLTELERRVFEGHQGYALSARIDSMVRSAPNYTDDPRNTFKSFPANEVDWWFRHLNYDDKPFDNVPMGHPLNVAVQGIAPVPNRFRSVRPLLTGHNPITNLIRQKDNGLSDSGIWQGLALPPGPPKTKFNILYPGMLCQSEEPNQNYPLYRYRGRYVPGQRYFKGDIVSKSFGSGSTKHEFTYIYVGPDNSTSIFPEADSWWNPKHWEPQPFVRGLAKASVNTAGFPELWRAYYLAMSDPDDITLCPYEKTETNSELTASRDNYRGMGFSGSTALTGTNQRNALRMFRSSLRDDRPLGTRRILDPNQMMVLRSALAAVNTITLRNKPPAGVVPTRNFTMYRFVTSGSNTNALRDYDVSVFGMVRQPFITEVYANNDTNTYGSHDNPAGYVAIELYNPYNTAINLKDWRLAILTRSGGTLNLAAPAAEHTFSPSDIVPAGGYLILESHDTANPGNTYRPPSSKLNLTGNLTGAVSVKILAQNTTIKALGNEVVLLRPKDAANPPLGTPAFPDMVPVDQFDFSGLALSTTANKTWHYVRSTSDWKFVYPGRYNGMYTGPRHQGVDVVSYKGSLFNQNDTQDVNKKRDAIDPWNPSSSAPSPFQEGYQNPSQPINLGNANISASYNRTCAIPWHTDLATPPKPPGLPPPTRVYPFGGFARNADILQVPFIGAYVIRDLNGNVVEMNAVTMDSAFAEDTLTDNNEPSLPLPTEVQEGYREQVGRFCPLMPMDPGGGIAVITNDWYDWTGRIFEYLDVHSPAEDFLPNIEPTTYANYLTSPIYPAPEPVYKSGSTDAETYYGQDEDLPVHGKININTAPRKVLAMLPLVPVYSGGGVGLIDDKLTEVAARDIDVWRRGYPNWRNSHFPNDNTPATSRFRDAFDTIMDLNRVVQLSYHNGKIAESATPGDKLGNYINDGLKTGYDDRFLITNRVSNLITTRSDTFTVYIVVQGWREADTPLPCLDWEQRKAFIIDRSAGTDKLKIIPVPTD